VNGTLQSAVSGVAAELARQLIGIRPLAKLVELLVFEDRPAMDGVLESFVRCLQMLNPRLERLQPPLPTGICRRAARPLLAASPQSTDLPRDGDENRPSRLRAWRLPAFGLRFYCSAPPDPLVGVAREERGNETRRAIGRY